ncbi:MAG: DUF262 domain-containing protein [Planctomycetia bacterium]|nr:DUF262 domain-containing protein [Planctomycetia bacterium]
MAKSFGYSLKDILRNIDKGDIQLPEFQRDWRWDDNRIRAILATLLQGYPMGAIMLWEYGNSEIHFKFRPIEGAYTSNSEPQNLILDGQQRMTSIYCATYSKNPVHTKSEKGKEIKRYYYLDLCKYEETNDAFESILSVPDNRQIRKNFNRDIELDLTTPELEYQNKMFPLNTLFENNNAWISDYKTYHTGLAKQCFQSDKSDEGQKHLDEVTNISYLERLVTNTQNYNLPVISLEKETPREAICKVFENVNTGGISLTVFELVTASFAMHNFNLREDWEICRQKIQGKQGTLDTDIMSSVNESDFLTAITLYTTYTSSKTTTCKKKDVLSLSFADYQKNKEKVLKGFDLACKFLLSQCIFREKDLPYTTQIIPLAVIFAVCGENVQMNPLKKDILEKWFWNVILGEMYGGPIETRFVNDVEDVINAIEGKASQNRTVSNTNFSATRLLTLQTRQSAAYKGVMALIYLNQCRDLLTGQLMTISNCIEGGTDIHHIFPEKYCKEQNLYSKKWNSIINKTPLHSKTNRSLGGNRPSDYCNSLLNKGIKQENLMQSMESHLIDLNLLLSDDFDTFFISRARKLLGLIEKAMRKEITDKDSEQTIQEYGVSLK